MMPSPLYRTLFGVYVVASNVPDPLSGVPLPVSTNVLFAPMRTVAASSPIVTPLTVRSMPPLRLRVPVYPARTVMLYGLIADVAAALFTHELVKTTASTDVGATVFLFWPQLLPAVVLQFPFADNDPLPVPTQYLVAAEAVAGSMLRERHATDTSRAPRKQ